MNREVEVYVDLEGQTHLVGRLWSRFSKGREGASFAYDPAWIASPLRFPLEPALSLDTGSHYTGQGRSLFGAVGDSAPDRWGRMLMKRMERRIAEREGRLPRTLMEITGGLGRAANREGNRDDSIRLAQSCCQAWNLAQGNRPDGQRV